MKRILIAAAALTVLATAGAASAQSYGAPQGSDRYERQDDRSGQRGTRPNERGGQPSERGAPEQRGGRQDRDDNDRGQYPRSGQDHGDRDRGGYADRGHHRGDNGDRRDGYRDGRYNGPGYGQWARRSPHRYHAGRYQAPRGYYARTWRRGEYLPPVYRGRGYYVDYRAYRLPPPPRGYGYYRHGDDVILTAIATGLIASVVFDLFD
jgi:Ni/Co efflux regulator RcnB